MKATGYGVASAGFAIASAISSGEIAAWLFGFLAWAAFVLLTATRHESP